MRRGYALDGWTVPGAPPGSPGNANDWTVGTSADTPVPVGELVDQALAREPDANAFLSGLFGRYPFVAAGGIVDALRGLGSPWRPRPGRSTRSTSSRTAAARRTPP